MERVLEHDIGTRTPAGGIHEVQLVSAGDLMRPQPYALVCKKWRDALRKIVMRFTFLHYHRFQRLVYCVQSYYIY